MSFWNILGEAIVLNYLHNKIKGNTTSSPQTYTHPYRVISIEEFAALSEEEQDRLLRSRGLEPIKLNKKKAKKKANKKIKPKEESITSQLNEEIEYEDSYLFEDYDNDPDFADSVDTHDFDDDL